MFAQFDKKGNGFIDFDEFVTGLASVCRGTLDDKIHFIFDMYDVSHDKSVSKQELATLLNQVPKEALSSAPLHITPPHEEFQAIPEGDSESLDNSPEKPIDVSFDEVDNYTNHDMIEKAFEECDLNHEGRLTYEEFKMWIQRNPSIIQYIESILPYNGPKDLNRHIDKTESLPHMRRVTSLARMSNAVSLQEVAGEVFNHNSVRRASNAVRPYRSSTSASNLSLGGSFVGSDSTSPLQIARENSTSSGVSSDHPRDRNASFNESFSHLDHEEQARIYLFRAMEITGNETLKESIGLLLDTMPNGRSPPTVSVYAHSHRHDEEEIREEVYHTLVKEEGYLWKKGKFFHQLSKRYYLLSGNCLYYYSKKDDVRPRGVVFLTGCIIERIADNDMALKGYFGFEILHNDVCAGHETAKHEHHRHDHRVLYCKSEGERDRWVVALQHAAHVVPIEDDYVIGKELGRGRFSVVCECVHKVTNQHCAVKIIDKNTIEKDEKELLRTEIAVLKLVNHPNIIRLEGIYESKNHIYIVMEMLKGGELFERIVGRPRFSELEAARLLRPLLESVAYLHDLGIVHRDLKPENILCGDELEDLKIADFGLSKMILPKEKMDAACGTLSYVAPEVLTMQGYGKEADLWSIGVIMFLLLCGKLPFDGDDHNEIIRSTIQGDLKVNPSVWNKLSDEAKALLTSFLTKSPKDRITARSALKHPFMQLFAAQMKRAHREDGRSLQRSVAASNKSERALGQSATSTANVSNTSPITVTETTAPPEDTAKRIAEQSSADETIERVLPTESSVEVEVGESSWHETTTASSVQIIERDRATSCDSVSSASSVSHSMFTIEGEMKVNPVENEHSSILEESTDPTDPSKLT